MAAQGPAAISIRGIATQMGMSAPFLYHYYQNRDELVTALIVDAYTTLTEMLEHADASCLSSDIADHALATLLAYREWATTHPTDFALVLGNPIPGYHAPLEITLPAARQSTLVFLKLAQTAWQQQRLSLPSEYENLPLDITPEFSEWCQQQGGEVAPPILSLILAADALIQGLLSLEIYGHTHYFLLSPAEFYRREMLAFLIRWDIAVKQ